MRHQAGNVRRPSDALTPGQNAACGVQYERQGAGQSHGALITEAYRSGSLALSVVGPVDALKERRADGTALAGSLDGSR